MPLPWLFCSGLCRSKLSSQNPSELRVFMAAGNTAGKISLVQITAPFSGLGGFLHGHFETIIVWTCFSGKFHTFLGPRGRKFLLLSYRFCATDCYVKAHIHTVAIAKKITQYFCWPMILQAQRPLVRKYISGLMRDLVRWKRRPGRYPCRSSC